MVEKFDKTKKAIFKDLKIDETNTKSDHNASIEALQSDKELKKVTALVSQSQAKAYAILEAIAERHNNNFLKSVLKKNLALTISVNARGRDDLVKISTFKTEKEHGFLDKLVNLTGRR